jgi:hypothetical protein
MLIFLIHESLGKTILKIYFYPASVVKGVFSINKNYLKLFEKFKKFKKILKIFVFYFGFLLEKNFVIFC